MSSIKFVICKILALAGVSLLWTAPVLAVEEELTQSKEVTGTVVSKNAQYLTLEYSKSSKGSYEIVIPLGKNVRLEHLQNLSELQTGDTVRVKYQEVFKPGKAGERIILRTVATNVALIRRATPDALLSKEPG